MIESYVHVHDTWCQPSVRRWHVQSTDSETSDTPIQKLSILIWASKCILSTITMLEFEGRWQYEQISYLDTYVTRKLTRGVIDLEKSYYSTTNTTQTSPASSSVSTSQLHKYSHSTFVRLSILNFGDGFRCFKYFGQK